MEEIPSVPQEDLEGRALRETLVMYDGPAYMRRARRVKGAFDNLLAQCQRQREEWLKMVKVNLGLLYAQAGSWDRLLPLLADEHQLNVLQELYQNLQPRLRAHIAPTSSVRALGQKLNELRASMERFNRRWTTYLQSVDLSTVNELRDGYNRYYVLEKECAVRSHQIARAHFEPLPPLTTDDLFTHFPLLPIPGLKA